MARPSVVLLEASAEQAGVRSAAKDLYTSELFAAGRHYAQSHAADWWILSPTHGLLHPDTVIDPHNDAPFGQLSAESRRSWAKAVHSRLLAYRHLPGFRTSITFLAAPLFGEYLIPWFTLDGRDPSAVEMPLAGRHLSEQRRWLLTHSAAPAPAVAAAPNVALSEIEDERPPVYEDNDAYIEFLRRTRPERMARRPTSEARARGADLPLFARVA